MWGAVRLKIINVFDCDVEQQRNKLFKWTEYRYLVSFWPYMEICSVGKIYGSRFICIFYQLDVQHTHLTCSGARTYDLRMNPQAPFTIVAQQGYKKSTTEFAKLRSTVTVESKDIGVLLDEICYHTVSIQFVNFSIWRKLPYFVRCLATLYVCGTNAIRVLYDFFIIRSTSSTIAFGYHTIIVWLSTIGLL